MSQVFGFLTDHGRARARLAALALAAFALSACAEAHLTKTPPPAQQQPAPPVASAPAPPPVEAPAPAEPDVAEPAGPLSDLPRKPGAVTVGLLLPLTGRAASFGRDLLAAAQMALFDLADSNYELRPYDTGGDIAQARSATAAALQDGVQVILGPLFSEAVLATADIARPIGVPVIAFSNNREIVGDGVYAMGFFPEDQVQRVVDYSYSQGLTQYSILAPDDQYGSRMVSALTQVAAGGREITDVAYYIDDTEALIETVKRLGRYDQRHQALLAQRRELAARNDEISRRALRRLEDLETLGDVGFEALVLPASSDEALRIAPLLAFYDIDPTQVKLLGTSLWDDPALGSEPSMVGAWFSAPSAATRERFFERFQRLYNRAADRRATLAYDAAALTIVLAQRAARGIEAEVDTDTNPFDIAALTAPSGFTGMDGIFRLRPSGLVERGLAVFEIGRDGAREIDPAPQSFDDFIN